jgi:hypothetical protein
MTSTPPPVDAQEYLENLMRAGQDAMKQFMMPIDENKFYVRDRGRFVSDDPRRAIHHQGRLRDRA